MNDIKMIDVFTFIGRNFVGFNINVPIAITYCKLKFAGKFWNLISFYQINKAAFSLVLNCILS